MRFDAEGLVARRGVDRLVWSGFWIPALGSLATYLDDLSVWCAEDVDRPQGNRFEKAYRAGRRAAICLLDILPSLGNWEGESLARVFGQEGPPEPLWDRLDQVPWESLDAITVAVKRIWGREFSRRCPETVTLVPYPHIDHAWFMPESLTPTLIEGAAGTLLAEAPLSLTSSYFGPAFYWDLLERNRPIEFARLVDATRGDPGLWPTTWTEPDFELITGDSIVAQLRLGGRFAKAKWAATSTVAWFPDSPGFPSCMPQLLSDAGIVYLYTARLRFNAEEFRSPGQFVWSGPGDASVIVEVSYTPQGYLGDATGAALIRGIGEFGALDGIGAIYPVGYSGGGLPTVREWRSIPDLIESGVQPLPLGRRVNALSECERTDDSAMPVWSGPLPLYAHRGIASVDVIAKSLFRAVEEGIERLKLCSALYAAEGCSGSTDVRDFESVLSVLQAHDTIDATAPESVNVCTARALKDLLARVDAAINGLLGSGRASVLHGSVCAVNVSNVPIVPQLAVSGAKARQYGANGDALVASRQALDPLKCALVEDDESVASEVRSIPGGVQARNPSTTVEVFEDGLVCIDTKGWRCPVRASRPTLDLDMPVWYDGWDIDPDHHLTQIPCKVSGVEVIEPGPVRAVIKLSYALPAGGLLEQLVKLWCNSERVEFEFRFAGLPSRTALRWSIKSSADSLLADVPYGTSVVVTGGKCGEWAGEQIASSWVHSSSGSSGYVVSSTSPFGFSAPSGILDVGIARSPGFPDPNAGSREGSRVVSVMPVGLGQDVNAIWKTARSNVAAMHKACSAVPESPVANASNAVLSGLRRLMELGPVSDISRDQGAILATLVNLDSYCIDVGVHLEGLCHVHRVSIVFNTRSTRPLSLEPGEVGRFVLSDS